jgi:hypothetical protein
VFHAHLNYFQEPPLEGRPNTKPGDHGTPNAHNRWFILLYHVWRPAWIKTYWNSIWLRARSHMTSQYTWGSVTTPHEFGSALRRPWHTFFWALTVSCSRLLARVWSDPYIHLAFTYLLCRSLKRSGNRTWTAPPFSTNERLKLIGHGLSVSCLKWPSANIRFSELNLKEESQQWHDLWAVGGDHGVV